MERLYYVIDAFSHERFGGNPAAVVLDAEGLTDTQMQRIAAEFNLSETTFVLLPGTKAKNGSAATTVRFRWFTPLAEVSMCGHATIAGVHALVESGELALGKSEGLATVRIETVSGLLTAYVEPIPNKQDRRMIWLELRPPTLEPKLIDRTELAAVLRISPDGFEASLPIMATQDADLIVFVRGMKTLNEAEPDFTAMSALILRERLRGMSLATVNTVTPSISMQSRFFAPTFGVDEDPVTGSVHGPLAAYLAKHGLIPLHNGVGGFMAVQGKPGGRTGLVSALVEPKADGTFAVRIAGEAVTTMRGVLVS